jgi:hypothetical protein
MEWNLIKAYLMDWNTKRYFEVGDTFVTCYIQPQVWQLLELFGDGSGAIYSNKRRQTEFKEMFKTPLTVGKLINMSGGSIQRDLEWHWLYEPDIHAWTHLMCQAYDAKPEKNVYTISTAMLYTRSNVKRDAPISVFRTNKYFRGKVGNTRVWCNKTRAEKVENEGNHTVSVSRPVEFSNLTGQFTKVNKHVLNFCPLRQEYGGQGHLHTGSFQVEVLTYGKIHNDYFENPTSVSGKKLYEMFGDQSPLWNKTDMNIKHPTLISPSCMKPWSEDMVITVEKVCHCCEIITLKVQKVKYLWNVEVTNDGEGNTKIQAVEYPDPSTKYPNGVVMTRIFKVPIVKTEQCWRVDPDSENYKHERDTYIHGIEKLLASECIRKKGSKRPATRPSWMN